MLNECFAGVERMFVGYVVEGMVMFGGYVVIRVWARLLKW